MAVDPKLSYEGCSVMLGGLTTALSSGLIRIYDAAASIPTNADDSNGSDTLLATLTFSSTAFGSASNGVITANAITADSSADATGTADYARLYNSAGTTCYFQGTCGTSNADFILNNTSIQSGANVSCSSFTITLPRE